MGTLRQKLKQKSCRNAAYCLDAQSLLSLLFYTADGHLLRYGTAHRGKGPPTQIINQKMKNTSQTKPETHLKEAIPQLTVPLLKWMTLICIKLTKPNQQTLQTSSCLFVKVVFVSCIIRFWFKVTNLQARCLCSGWVPVMISATFIVMYINSVLGKCWTL